MDVADALSFIKLLDAVGKFSEAELRAKIRVIDLSKMTLFEVVAQIKERPLYWLNEYTIEQIDVFLRGWAAGKYDWTAWCSFSDYVGSLYKAPGAIGWAKILIEHEDENALSKALQLFDDFEAHIDRDDTENEAAVCVPRVN